MITVEKVIKVLEKENLIVDKNCENDTEVEFISYDSRIIKPKTLFFCKGKHYKPEYLGQAIEKGANIYVSLEKYDVDAATAGNMVNDFNYIEGIEAWAVFTTDKTNNNIRGSIRSRGPVINEIATKYRGGGHKYASGVRLKDFKETDLLIEDLDRICAEFKNNS